MSARGPLCLAIILQGFLTKNDSQILSDLRISLLGFVYIRSDDLVWLRMRVTDLNAY